MGSESKCHLVGWDKVCVPMSNGGLQIRKLTMFNKALLGKWLWHFGVKESHLWRRVITTKFGEEWGGGLLSWAGVFMIVVCGEICMGCGWEDFSQNTWFEIRVGNRVRFWHNCWCGVQPLQVTFPVLYEIAMNKETFVALSLTRKREGGRGTWDVRFARDLNDWEVGSMVDFLHFLENNTPLIDNGD